MRQLHSDAGGGDAVQFKRREIGVLDAIDRVINADDCVRINFFGGFDQRLQGGVLQGVGANARIGAPPGGGCLNAADRIEDASAFDLIGETDAHDDEIPFRVAEVLPPSGFSVLNGVTWRTLRLRGDQVMAR